MTTDPTTFRTEVLLSMQRALWDLVTPELRAVAVRAEFPLITARFLYDSVGEAERLTAAEAEANVIADFLPPVDVSFSAIAVPMTARRDLEIGEDWAYRRAEDEAK